MLFITLDSQQVAAYSYACSKLHAIERKMMAARKNLEETASLSDNKFFSKCIHMFSSEALQLEHEIHAQIESFNCSELLSPNNSTKRENKKNSLSPVANMHSLYSYIDDNYIQPYKQLLKDKRLNQSLKNLINTHFKILSANLTQLKLFIEVGISVN